MAWNAPDGWAETADRFAGRPHMPECKADSGTHRVWLECTCGGMDRVYINDVTPLPLALYDYRQHCLLVIEQTATIQQMREK